MRFISISLAVLMVSLSLAEDEATKSTRPTTGKQYDVEVIVKSVFLDYVPLRPKSGTGDNLISNDRFIVIKLEFKNNGGKDVNYRTVNGTPGQPGYSVLLDGRRQACTLAAFGDLEPIGLTRTATIKPGESIEDVLAFLPCKDCQGKLTLLLPDVCFGGVSKTGKAALTFDMPKDIDAGKPNNGGADQDPIK